MTSSGETSPLAGTPAATPGSASQTRQYGTIIPNRVFVGGIPSNTQEHELKNFFSQFGAVKDCKIIVDRSGVSKGSYGFVTFETLEDAEKVIKHETCIKIHRLHYTHTRVEPGRYIEGVATQRKRICFECFGENLIFNGRKLNIGPAIRKQQTYPRMDLAQGAVYFSNGIPYTYQNGMAVFHADFPHLPAQPQPAATYPGLTVQAQPNYIPYLQTSPQAAATAAVSFAGAASPWRWSPQSPGAAMGSPTYQLYQTAAMAQAAMPEMAQIYQPHYFTPGEMSDLEANAAAAAAAEGSMAMELNMYAEKVLTPAAGAALAMVSSPAMMHSMVSSSPSIISTATTAATSTKPSPVVYGKRPGSALVTPPCKMMSTQHCSVLYSPGLTPTPPYYKYDRSTGFKYPTPLAAVNGRAFVASSDASPATGTTNLAHAFTGGHFIGHPASSVIQLTPPATPNVK